MSLRAFATRRVDVHMDEEPPGESRVPRFTPELADEIRARLRAILGSTWNRIAAEDDPSRPERHRHLLAVIDEHADRFRGEFASGRFPRHLPDFMALYLVVNVLGRASSDPAFRELLPGLVDRREFRHHMLTLGLADHLRMYTSYMVRLPTRDQSGRRIVDLVVGTGPTLNIEAKSSDEFDGPRRHVSSTNAYRGIRNAWRSAYGGVDPRLPDDSPGAVLVGGVTVEVASLPQTARTARAWLERRGSAHPQCWGILAMTFLTVSRLPPGRRFGDGAPLTANVLASPLLSGTPNPHYRGELQLVLTPPVW
jgi:hypothetical protein